MNKTKTNKTKNKPSFEEIMENTLEFYYNMYNFMYFNDNLKKVDVIFNNRTTTTAGTHRIKRNRLTGEILKEYIEISSKYIKAFPDDFINVLVHEMIHVKYPNEGHDDNFLKEMKMLNDTHEELNLGIYTNYKIKQELKYTYECQSCSKSFKRARRFNTDKYVCAKCNGKFKLLDNSLLE